MEIIQNPIGLADENYFLCTLLLKVYCFELVTSRQKKEMRVPSGCFKARCEFLAFLCGNAKDVEKRGWQRPNMSIGVKGGPHSHSKMDTNIDCEQKFEILRGLCLIKH